MKNAAFPFRVLHTDGQDIRKVLKENEGEKQGRKEKWEREKRLEKALHNKLCMRPLKCHPILFSHNPGEVVNIKPILQMEKYSQSY